MWHTGQTDDRFIYAAFATYRNCDGKGGSFGETGLAAGSSDVERTSVYASLNTQHRVVVVAINKSAQAIPVQTRLSNCPKIARAAVFRLTQAAPRPVWGYDLSVVRPARLDCELPAQSVSTLVLATE